MSTINRYIQAIADELEMAGAKPYHLIIMVVALALTVFCLLTIK